MKAMILAAGGGTRLQPLTFTLPKPMVPVANVPVMEHILRLLAQHDFTDLVINLHYLPEFITDYFVDGSRFSVRIHYSHEEQLLGTAGGVKKMRDFFDEDFAIIGGDDLCDFNLTEIMQFHRSHGALATLSLTEAEDTTQFGVVVTDGTGRIQQFQEKPKKEEALSNLINTQVYFLSPRIFDWIPDGVYDFGRQLFPRLLEERQTFYGYRASGYWCDVGNPGEYWRACCDALTGRVKLRIPGEQVRPGVWIDAQAQVHPTASIDGPAVIGRDSRIGAGARLRGPVVIGPGAIVGDQAEVSESMLWEQCEVAPRAQVCRVLAGDRARLEGELRGRVLGGDQNRSEVPLVV